MEYWEVTKERAHQTLPLWTQYLPALQINGKTVGNYEGLIEEFELLAQDRVEAQDVYDEAVRLVRGNLLKMKILGTKLPAMISSQLDEEENLMKDVQDLYSTSPRTESTILRRARELHPVWVRANAVLAAMTPAQPPMVRSIAGVEFTVVSFKSMLDGFNDNVKEMKDKLELLDKARADLRALDAQVDRLNKNWYKYVKNAHDPGDPVYDQLSGITVEPSTPVPETVEIDTVSQGGEEGLQALVAYVPGGGDHATTSLIQWMVDSVDTDFTNESPLDQSGNALGPFAVGQVVRIRTLVRNSAGERTTAVRTITIETPIV